MIGLFCFYNVISLGNVPSSPTGFPRGTVEHLNFRKLNYSQGDKLVIHRFVRCLQLWKLQGQVTKIAFSVLAF